VRHVDELADGQTCRAATGGFRSTVRALSQDLAQFSQRFAVFGAVSPLLGRDDVRQVGSSDDKAVALDDVRSVDEVLVTQPPPVTGG
jgi:hypothetical protein